MRGALLVLGVLVSLAAGGLLLDRFYSDAAFLPPDDFLQYWAAGRLNATGGNPYNADRLLELQRGAGRPADRPAVMMWNPPWVLTLAMPFGLMPPRTAQLVWLLLQVAIIVFSADRFWLCFGGDPRRRPIVWGLALAFFPVMYIVFAGQSSGWLLLGLMGLLASRGRYWECEAPAEPLTEKQCSWEGEAPAEPLTRGLNVPTASQSSISVQSARQEPRPPSLKWWFALLLPFVAIKPHLFVPIWIALLCEAGRTRRGLKRLGVGLAAGLVAILIPTLVNADVWQQYFAAMNRPVDAAHSPLSGWKSPLIGYWIRATLAPEAFWIQAVPTLIVAIAMPIYLWKRRKSWQWNVELPRLVLVGLIAAPYGAWPYDQIVLLVPVIAGFARLLREGSRGQFVAAFVLLGIINGVALTIREGEYFVWVPPAITLWFAWVLTAKPPVTLGCHSTRERAAGCGPSLSSSASRSAQVEPDAQARVRAQGGS